MALMKMGDGDFYLEPKGGYKNGKLRRNEKRGYFCVQNLRA
jgi:hypothetical protein